MLESGIGAFTQPPAIAGENVTIAFATANLVVTKRNQFLFVAPFAPPEGAVLTAIVDRLTYFEPDFRIIRGVFTWQREALPIGTVIRLEAWVGGADHWRAERVLVANGASAFRLSAPSVGNRCTIFVNGRCFTEHEGAFETRGPRVRWLQGPGPGPADSVVALYPRTMEGAMALHQEAFPLHPARGRTFDLAIEPRPAGRTRLYHRGLRYIEGDDFTVSGSAVASPPGIALLHGEVLAVLATTGANYFVKTAETPEVARQLFVESHVTVQADGDAIASMPAAALAAPGKALLSLNGLTYPEQAGGFLREGSDVLWDDGDMTLRAGDDLGLWGLLGDRAAGACVIKEIPAGVGWPMLDLGEQAADVRKTMLFVSSGGFGGQLYLGPRWLTFVDERTIQWNGPFPLKASDRLVAVIWKDPLVAAALRLHTQSITLAEAGLPFAYRLPHPPSDPGRVLVAQNGQRLAHPADFTMLGGVFNYGLPVTRSLHVGDEFVFLYR